MCEEGRRNGRDGRESGGRRCGGGGDNRRVEEVKVEGRGGGVARDDMC